MQRYYIGEIYNAYLVKRAPLQIFALGEMHDSFITHFSSTYQDIS